MSVTAIDDLAARLQSEDEDLFLGKLFWYDFSEVRVPHPVMVQFLAKAGITKNLPFVPDDVDVFKRACKKMGSRTKVATSDAQVFENYVMQEFRDTVSVTKRIVRETVDHKGKTLDFTECADMVFDRATSVVTSEAIGSDPISVTVAEIIEATIEYYELWRDCLGTYPVRQWVRNFLLNLNAVQVKRGGGLYFLRMVHSDQLDALERLAELINSAEMGSIEFHSLPLLDDRKQRQMVQRAFEAETTDAIDTMLVEIAAIADSERTITADTYADIVTKFQSLVGKTKEYEALLEDTLSTTGSRLKVFQKSLINLRGKVK